MELNLAKDSEFQGTNESLERSQMNSHLEKVECDNTATSDESYPTFELLCENIYLGNKKKRVNKEIRRMSCDCPFNPEDHEFVGCGEDCLNRLLMIECNNRCPCGEFCSNRKFQKFQQQRCSRDLWVLPGTVGHHGQKVKVEAFKTLKKGWGLRTLEDIPANHFVMEYCGEVMGYEEFEKRVETYDKENRRHYYFMTLRADEIIDATHKGNLSRFINHSCSPNCETQKWTVNGYLRIGFFTLENIKAGNELTFDYKFQRYGKKAQACYCGSPNCRGIIGGEKHTPLKSIISGRAASPACTGSPRRNQRRRLAEQFDDKPLEIEIAQLLGGEKGIKSDEQALKLSQFMVRAETPSQRLLLLDTLLATEDQNCLRSFVRYQGLSLLWSWMVDLGENSQRVPKKIVQALKHLPVANLNQIKDSKVLKVIRKWARKPSVTCVAEEETSSSDVDSRGLSPLELIDDIVKREGKISSSCAETVTAADDFRFMSASKNLDTPNPADESTDTTETKTSEAMQTDARTLPGEQGAEFKKINESDAEKSGELKDNENAFEACELKNTTLVQGQNHSGLAGDTPKTEDSEEEESRWSEDDSASTDSEHITDLAADLLDSWSNLKEVYRIPKKSTNIEKREPESTSSAVSAVEAAIVESSNVRGVAKILAIPTIEGDLFQKDEFLSKLGERKLVDQKPGDQELTGNSTEIPALMGNTLTKPESDDSAMETGKLSIHQRLQMVASGGNVPKQYPVWHGKGNKKARKHPYHSGGGSFQPGLEKWGPRHQVTGKSRFNPPTGHPPNKPMHPGVCGPPRPNIPNNQWQGQHSSPYPGPYQFPPSGGPRSSAPVGYPTPNPNHPSAPPPPMQSSYFAPGGVQHMQTGNDNRFQAPFPAQASHDLRPTLAPPNLSEQSSFGPGLNPRPAQPGVQTDPHGFQQIQRPVNSTLFPLPPFDPSQPPPNFVPSKSNIPPQQLPSAGQSQFANASSQIQFPNNSSQFPNAPLSCSATTSVPNVPSYPLQSPQMKQPVVSLTSQPSDLGQSQAMATQRSCNVVSTTSVVSSTVSENATKAVDRSTINISRKSEHWTAEPHSKSRDISLPPNWKMAYDGEGRAYYYHVVTRQTQWEMPAADRSPPTPEIGYLGDELDSSVEMTTSFHSQSTNDVVMEEVDKTKRKKPKTPSTPPGSPPISPVGKYTTAAADTTDVRKGLYSPSVLLQARHLTPEQRKLRETFRMKLSAVVVNYLNPYHKLDCKVGRITTVDDFKFLARKLTHGVMVKELSRLKDESELACNDSVKIKTKDYIRQYMQKFGPVYKAS